jgi:MATE family multidrug resistance protein
MTDIENIRDISYQYSFWIVLLPFVSSFCYQFDGIFIGASQTKELRNAMFVSVAIYLISSFMLVENFGNQGLWISFTIFLILRALTLAFYFNRIYLKI